MSLGRVKLRSVIRQAAPPAGLVAFSGALILADWRTRSLLFSFLCYDSRSWQGKLLVVIRLSVELDSTAEAAYPLGNFTPPRSPSRNA
jgi:hypothetical protein